MMFFLIYLVIGTIAGTVTWRKVWESLSDYDRKHNSEKAGIPAGLIGVFWPAGIPLALTIIGTNKVLDKITKV